MAIVGEAHIIVRALTNKVKGDIRNGFKGSEQLGSNAGKQISGAFSKAFNAAGQDGVSFFGKVAKGLDALRPGSKQAYEGFAALQRKFYTMGTALGGLIGGIGALGNAVIALGGALGGAAPVVVSFGSAMVALKLAGMVGKFAMKGVTEAAAALSKEQKGLGKTARELREDMQQLAFQAEEAALGEMRASLSLEQARENLAMVQDLPPNSRARREAELAYAEADLNMRQAIDRNKDLQEQQAKGKSGFGLSDTENALRGLNSYQQTFAKFLAGLSKNMTRLRLVAARGLLPPLQGALSVLVKKGMPVLEKGVSSIAIAMGKASQAFVKIITSSQNLKTINSLMQSSAKFIEDMGKPLGNIFAILVLLLKEAAPLLNVFTKFLNKKTKGFLADLRLKESTGELRKFFAQAGRLTAKLSATFGNLFGAFGGIIKSSVGKNSGGEMLLDWFKEVTGKWKVLRNSPEGIEKMRKSLFMGSENAKRFLQLVGSLVTTVFGALQTPNIGEFFTTLEKGMPALKNMFEEVGTALPQFGELIVNILRFFGAFAQSGAVVEFFKILNGAAKMLADFMEKPMVKAFFKATAKIHAFALAFGLLLIYGGKALDVVVGGMSKLSGTLDKVAQHPILATLAALSAAFMYLYHTNSEFKKSMDETWKTIQDAVQPIVDALNLAMAEFGKILSAEVTTGVNKLVGPIGDLAKTLMSLIPPLMEAIVPTLKIFVDILVLVIKYAAELAAQLAASLVPVIKLAAELFGMLLNAAKPLVDLLLGDLIPVFASFIHQVVNLATTLIKDLAPVFKSIIDAITPLISLFAEMAGTVLRELLDSLSLLFAAFTGKGSGLNGIISGLVDIFELLGDVLLTTLAPILNSLITHLFPVLNSVISQIAPVIIEMAQQILPVIAKILTAFGEVFGQIANAVIPIFSGLVQAIIPVVKILLDQLVPIIDSLVTAFLPLLTSIMPALTPLLSTLAIAFEEIVSAIGSVIQGLMPSIMTLLGMLQPIFAIVIKVVEALAKVFEALIPPITSFIKLIVDLAGDILKVLIDVVISLVDTLLPVFDIFIKLLDPIGELIRNLLPPLKSIISAVVDVFIVLVDAIMPVVDAFLGILIPLISTIVRTVVPPLIDVFELLVDSIVTIFDAVMPAISSVLESLLPVFAEIVQAISPLIQVLLNQIGHIIEDLIIPLLDALITPLLGIIKTFADLVGAVAPFISQIVSSLLPILTQLIDILVPLIDDVLGALIPVIGDILSAIMPLISNLIDALLPVFADIIKVLMPFIAILIEKLVPVLMHVVEALMPVIDLLVDALLPFLPMIGDLFKELVPPLLEIVKALVKLLVPAIEILLAVFEPILDIVIALVDAFVGMLKPAIGILVSVLNPVITIFQGLIGFITSLIPLIVNGLAGAFKGITAAAKIFAEVFKAVFKGISIVVKGVLNGLLISLEAVLNFIIAAINLLMSGINLVLDGIRTATFGAVDIKLEPLKAVKLTRLAKGGTVMPSPGGSIVNIAEAGKPERVVPLDSNGLSAGDKAVLGAIKNMSNTTDSGSNIEVNVYAAEGMSVKDLAAEVSRQLMFSMRKGTI